MYDYTILCEKPSASRNFAKALGGMKGEYNGKKYQIVSARGHLLSFVEPHEMVDQSVGEKYKSWALNMMPWDLSKLQWTRKPKRSDEVKLVKSLGASFKTSKSVVIATDVDPSGEGQLIAWEILDEVKWNGDVYRMNFADEAEVSIQKAFDNMVKLPPMLQDGEYLKAEARSRFDFASMQLTRIASKSAESEGYHVTARQGRLKSVMVSHVYAQEQAIKNYVRKPYYEVKFKDENGHTFARKLTKEQIDNGDAKGIRFDQKADAERDAQTYHEDAVTDVKRTRKTSAPGALLDLSTLSSILSTKGFSADTVLSTYQKMYEETYVSYPRTEDKQITPEQFNEMLPLVNRIASVVSVDINLLTHRTPRKTHVKEGCAHGANRPGKKVPASLSEIDAFGGKCAVAIYETLALNFLAMFGEDYEYESVTARLTTYPDFVTAFTVPIKLNYKEIFDTSKQSKDDDNDENTTGNDIGTIGSPFVSEGANAKPSKPTMKWLMSYLNKKDVGTGATRTSTLAEITKATKQQLMTEKRGVLATTDAGKVTAITAKGTFIANADITKQLFDFMKDVGKGKATIDNIMKLANDVITHDKQKMMENAKDLRSVLGEPSKKLQGRQAIERAEGIWVKTNAKISFKRTWKDYRFTDEDVKTLLNGGSVSVTFKTSKGSMMTVSGVLAVGEYNGHKFVGFKPDFDSAPKPVDPNKTPFKDGTFKNTWGGHKFTEAELKALADGQSITFKHKGKYGVSMVTGSIQKQEFTNDAGKKVSFYGFKKA